MSTKISIQMMRSMIVQITLELLRSNVLPSDCGRWGETSMVESERMHGSEETVVFADKDRTQSIGGRLVGSFDVANNVTNYNPMQSKFPARKIRSSHEVTSPFFNHEEDSFSPASMVWILPALTCALGVSLVITLRRAWQFTI